MNNIEQALSGLQPKIKIAIARIRSYCKGKKTLVAFSGGKDSQTCFHLCQQAGIDFEAQYSITRFEPPEMIRFMREHYPQVTFRRAFKMSLVDEIVYRGLPTRWARWCCNCKHVKTEGFDIAVIGVRAQESPRRRDTWRTFGRKPDGTFYVCPIFDWTSDEVWTYLNGNHIPHCSLYDEGFKRVGCVCCPLATTKKRRDQFRWPKIAAMLYNAFLKHWEKAVAAGGVTKTGKPYKMLSWGCPRFAFEHWLSTGSVNFDDNWQPPAECAFAGSGFSESDGVMPDEE